MPNSAAAASRRRWRPRPGPSLPAPLPTPGQVFPLNPLGIKVELLLNGTWTDVSTFVLARDNIQITRGRADESSTMNVSQLTLTFNNQDGRFSPLNTSGAFYPFIGRNTQIRVSVNTTSITGVQYSGYRFWGEVSAWPPRWDSTGTDISVPITASGVMRRLQQNATIGSAIRKYITLLTGAIAPVAYWPMEEATSASQFGNLIVPGDDLLWSGQPTLASDTSFAGSDPIPLMSLAIMTGTTGSFSSSGDDIFTTPGNQNWVSPITGNVTAKTWGGGGGGGGAWQESNVLVLSGGGGGGGEYAQDTVAVTQGSTYPVTVGVGGTFGHAHSTSQGISAGDSGSDGGFSSFTGDTLTCLANGGGGGSGGRNEPFAYGRGGNASANAIHHPGGDGQGDDSQTGNNYSGGGGGGGSAGPSSAGNDGTSGGEGSVASDGTPGPGGAAVSGGGAGGTGGFFSTNGNQGATPGGGGGGGGASFNKYFQAGANGAAGKVELVYSGGGTVPNAVVVRHLLHVPDTGSVNGATVLRAVISSGTLARVELYYTVNGALGFRGLNSGSSTIFDTGPVSFAVDGQPVLVSMELVQKGSNFTYRISTVVPGADTFLELGPTSVSGTLGAVSQIVVNPGGTINDTAIGHITVQYALDDITNISNALNGNAGEMAGARFQRFCNEAGLSFEFNGNISDTPQMGPQQNKKLSDLLQEIEDADQGQLFEPRDTFGLGYSTRVSLMNQNPTLSVDYTNAHLAGDLEPATDDQLVRNDVTVSRQNGADANATLTDGSLSILDPPNGIGDYSFSLTANVDADSQVGNLAQWILNIGTVDEYRYPTVTFDQTRTEVATLIGQIAILDVGDFFQIFQPPSWLPPGTINQLAFGFTETLNAFLWTISINAVPESPYEGAGLTW